MKDEFYVPSPEHILPQSSNNKQGRAGERYDAEVEASLVERFRSEQAMAYRAYGEMLDQDVAREIARINLPLSMYTEWYWQIDLHNLFHFLRLRMDPHAQYEIRVYAEAMAQCAKAVAPLAYEAFEEHILGSVAFSRAECEALSLLLAGKGHPLDGRALATFEEKLAKLDQARPTEAPEEFQSPQS